MASDESFLLCIKGCFYLHSYRRLCACASVPLCGSHLRVTPEALYQRREVGHLISDNKLRRFRRETVTE
jgi:hypothetical protein